MTAPEEGKAVQNNEALPETEYSLPSEVRAVVRNDLQALLSELLMLAAQMKQGHWNLRGGQFHSIHLQLDDIVASLRTHVDEVAERISTLGFTADGRIGATHENSTIAEFPGGLVPVNETVGVLSTHLNRFNRDARQRLNTLGDSDPISEDLVIGVIAELEKHQWMLRSQLRQVK